MAFLEQLLGGGVSGDPINVKLTKTTQPSAEPITIAEAKAYLKAVGVQDDGNLAIFIAACRQRIEAAIERTIFTTTWRQAQDSVDSYRVKLFRRPAIRINSIKYIAGMEADTELVWPSSQYIFNGDEVVARSAFPSHRGFGSFIMYYDTGMVDLTQTAPSEAAIAAAQALVPADIKLAILNYMGFFFENREGEAPVDAFERVLSLKMLVGELPKNVKALLMDYMDYRL